MRRVLLVDEDPYPRAELSQALRRADCTTLESADVWSALEALPAWHPNLIVLDWRGSDSPAAKALDRLTSDTSTRDIPVMLVSEDDSGESRVAGLQRGGDDYVRKPYTMAEVIARINALLRRSAARSDVIEIGGLILDAASHTVTTDQGDLVRLRPAEFRLLHFFMSHPDSVYTRSQLLQRVWDYRDGMGERSVDVHIRRLRQALADEGRDAFIQTVRGVGYRFSSRYLI